MEVIDISKWEVLVDRNTTGSEPNIGLESFGGSILV